MAYYSWEYQEHEKRRREIEARVKEQAAAQDGHSFNPS